MLVIGARGFAKEVLEVLHQTSQLDNLVFYDDVNDDVQGKLYNQFPILKNIAEAEEFFSKYDKRFTIGLGNPVIRRRLCEKFTQIGGHFVSTVSSTAVIGSYGTEIGEGSNIMQHVAITNDVKIGKGVLINQLTSIGHDVIIGDFSEICPNVAISGNCSIGKNVFIGTGAILLPKISIGDNAVIAAGAVVKDDVPDKVLIAGIPGVIKKYL